MSLPKILAVVTVLLFGVIGLVALFKSGSGNSASNEASISEVVSEVELDQGIQVAEPAALVVEPAKAAIHTTELSKASSSKEFPDADRIPEFFNKEGVKLPFVETITYKSRVSWQKGRPAWLSDYAIHYNTSRHFIARSLNEKPDYLNQNVSEGDRFNVYRSDKKIEFYLVVDTSRCRMWFYCIDPDTDQATLLKTYQVGLGRLDPSKTSGLLTPLGKYSIGKKTASYQPKATGYHNGKKVEMLTVFGTRWIPFDKEIDGTTTPAKGFGIHGAPWIANDKGVLAEDRSSLGKYESDGCIRMSAVDVEEIYAIISSKPATIELVRDFWESKLASNKD